MFLLLRNYIDSYIRRLAKLHVIFFFYYIKMKSRLSVCLSAIFLAALITLPSRHVSTPGLLDMKATSSGINKFVSKSF